MQYIHIRPNTKCKRKRRTPPTDTAAHAVAEGKDSERVDGVLVSLRSRQPALWPKDIGLVEHFLITAGRIVVEHTQRL